MPIRKSFDQPAAKRDRPKDVAVSKPLLNLRLLPRQTLSPLSKAPRLNTDAQHKLRTRHIKPIRAVAGYFLQIQFANGIYLSHDNTRVAMYSILRILAKPMNTSPEESLAEDLDGRKPQRSLLSALWPRLIELWLAGILVVFFLVRVLGSQTVHNILARFQHHLSQ